MKSTYIFISSWIIVLIIAFHPGMARCELKSLDDAELSTVEAEGVTAGDVNTQTGDATNSGILSVTVNNSDPSDLNDPSRQTNTLRPAQENNNLTAAPQNQFNNLSRPANCCTSGAPMPGCH
jgi:hypothetical protein